MSPTFYTDIALGYCDDVLAGRILACKQVHQACQRHINDLASIDDPAFPYTYDIAKAERICRFSTKLPHVAGRFAVKKDNRFKPEPWQVMIFTSLFGWMHKSTGFRRFTEALISVPRKNGKSFMASVIALYMLICDNEPGAQCFAAANNLTQALTVFQPAKLMVERTADLRETFEVDCRVKSLIMPDSSSLVPLVGLPRDGSSAHLAILDEYHESKTDELYLALAQSTGAREQPLMLITSTAGVGLQGPFHAFVQDAEQTLDKTIDRPELFAVIYTIDKDDDWTTTEALQKSNPNLGVSVNLLGLRTEHQNAIKNAAKQNAFKTKKLNMWVGSSTAWLNIVKWQACGDSKLTPEAFIGQPCWFGADLSSKLDLTCILKLFKVGGQYYLFERFYLPAERAKDESLGMYAKWVEQGWLTATDGNVLDMERVLEDTVADIELYKPSEVCYDKWQSDMFVEYLGKRCPGVRLAEIPNLIQFISPAMKETEALVESKKLHHANNPVMEYCCSNVMAYTDRHGNVGLDKPRKGAKIDGVSALMYAMNRARLNGGKKMFEPFFC